MSAHEIETQLNTIGGIVSVLSHSGLELWDDRRPAW